MTQRLPQLGRELDRLFNLFLPDLRDSGRCMTWNSGPAPITSIFRSAVFRATSCAPIRKCGGTKIFLMFTRMTRLKEPHRPEVMVVGRHFGVALAAKGEVSLIARNRASPFQVSVVNIQPNFWSSGISSGCA